MSSSDAVSSSGQREFGRRGFLKTAGSVSNMFRSLAAGLAIALAIALTLIGAAGAPAQAARPTPPPRPEGPCDIYAAGGTPCVAAHSTTRTLYASYNGPLYQVKRLSDNAVKDIGVVAPVALPHPAAGGYADAAAQDAFCANTTCFITKVYDDSQELHQTGELNRVFGQLAA